MSHDSAFSVMMNAEMLLSNEDISDEALNNYLAKVLPPETEVVVEPKTAVLVLTKMLSKAVELSSCETCVVENCAGPVVSWQKSDGIDDQGQAVEKHKIAVHCPNEVVTAKRGVVLDIESLVR